MAALATADPSVIDLAEASRVERYARQVVDGELVTGRLVRRACERHLDDLAEGHLRGLRFDESAAGWAIRFFPMMLRHYKGDFAGQPLVLADWQAFVIGSIFGWMHEDPEQLGRWIRRFARGYVEVAKKNGKTTMFAGVGILLAFFDDEAGAEVYSAATKKDQAKLAWTDALHMVKGSPALTRRIRNSVNSLYDTATASFFKPISSETGGEEGINPHAVLVDELHRLKTRTLVDMLSQSFGARSQPFFGEFTTAGEEGESIWAEEHDYAAKVVDQVVDDDATFVFIAMLDKDDDPFDEANWPKANPNLGVSIRLDELRRRAAEAKAEPRKLNSFLRLRMDVKTNQTTRFIPMDHWDACDLPPDLDDASDVWGGLDMGWSRDLCAFILWAPHSDGSFSLVPHFWMPESSAELRRSKDRVPYDVWAREGFLTLTDGDVRDDDAIEEGILKAIDGLEMRVVKFDRAMSTNLVNRLTRHGLAMEPLGQGIVTLSAPTKELERLTIGHRIRHGGHPLLRWMAGNATAKTDDNGNVRLAKPHGDSPLKVDGISATVDAIAGWLEVQDEEDEPSIWEQEGRSLVL